MMVVKVDEREKIREKSGYAIHNSIIYMNTIDFRDSIGLDSNSFHVRHNKHALRAKIRKKCAI